MTTDSINEWVENAKAHPPTSTTAPKGVKVVRKPPQKSRGAIIMAVADALRPHFMKMFEGVRDQDNMLAQQAHVRAFALNVAQRMVLTKEQDNNAAA